jgi:uncharacterized RDD family membrane protein YckC
MDYQEYLDKYVSYDRILARRCWAALIDYVVYFLLLILYAYFFGDVQEWGFKDNGGFSFRVNPGFFPTVILWFLYFPAIESIFGYTLGKGALDLKVIFQDKKEFPFVVSLKRHLLDPIDFAFFGLVGILFIKFSEEHKRLGDFWAKSLVVKEES